MKLKLKSISNNLKVKTTQNGNLKIDSLSFRKPTKTGYGNEIDFFFCNKQLDSSMSNPPGPPVSPVASWSVG